MEEKVILVNEFDEPIGLQEKLAAHRQGLLHRAFSIFIFNKEGKTLLQQRSLTKYHSGGLWTNACCSHPRDGETIQAAAQRRLKEEFGFQCPLNEVFSFIYKADVGGGLFEHEFDHVLFGSYDGAIAAPNPEEIESYRWVTMQALEKELEQHPERFTTWFRIIFAENRAYMSRF